MTSIDGIELSEDEIMEAKDLGLEDYLEDEKVCLKCGIPITKGNCCYSCAQLEKEDQKQN
jgi:hypothetical protein